MWVPVVHRKRGARATKNDQVSSHPAFLNIPDLLSLRRNEKKPYQPLRKSVEARDIAEVVTECMHKYCKVTLRRSTVYSIKKARK